VAGCCEGSQRVGSRRNARERRCGVLTRSGGAAAAPQRRAVEGPTLDGRCVRASGRDGSSRRNWLLREFTRLPSRGQPAPTPRGDTQRSSLSARPLSLRATSLDSTTAHFGRATPPAPPTTVVRLRALPRRQTASRVERLTKSTTQPLDHSPTPPPAQPPTTSAEHNHVLLLLRSQTTKSSLSAAVPFKQRAAGQSSRPPRSVQFHTRRLPPPSSTPAASPRRLTHATPLPPPSLGGSSGFLTACSSSAAQSLVRVTKSRVISLHCPSPRRSNAHTTNSVRVPLRSASTNS
jgi:hypothetical protein